MHAFNQESEQVVLLDSSGLPIGTELKETVHGPDTPLHAAFSVFLFDCDRRMLCQQRALHKKTWPGIWSNACCGHPGPGESTEDAAHRRLEQELGLQDIPLKLALPDFRYKATFQGIVENEICPVFVGLCKSDPTINREEVEAFKWVDWDDFAAACSNPPNSHFSHFSIWSLMEGKLLSERDCVDDFIASGCLR